MSQQREPWSIQKELACGKYRHRDLADMLMAGADMASIVNAMQQPLASNAVEAMLNLFDSGDSTVARAPGAHNQRSKTVGSACTSSVAGCDSAPCCQFHANRDVLNTVHCIIVCVP